MIYVKVEWDLEVDGKELTLEEAGLKEMVQLPDSLEQRRKQLGKFVEDDQWLDEVGEWLSDEHGYCHKGFKILLEKSFS